MTGAMRVRPATPGDARAIADLTSHYIATTAIHFGTDPVREDEVIAEMRAASERTPAHPWFVCEVDGAFAGFAKAYTWRGRAAYARTVETGLYVPPGLHRRGAGRALYGALLGQLAASGFHSAVAGIALPNEASVKLHEAVGFRYVGTFRECGWKLERWHDVGFWERVLSAEC